MSAKLFYREFHYQELDMARFLAEAHGFDSLYRSSGNPQTNRTKFFFVKQTLLDLFFLISRLKRIKTYGYIVALWHSAPAFILLKRLGLIHYDKLLWFGLAARTPGWFFLYRFIAKLDRENTWFVVFTQQEVDDYAERLNIERSRLLFVAHGDWPQPVDVPDVFSPDPEIDLETPFYFAGGFTNRDYQPVIETFRKLGKRLIIVCSKSNTDVPPDRELPANITVYRDITFPEFEMLLRASKAVIIPLKHDTGAAGHSVLVRSMRNGKLVIANDFRIVDNYIEPGVDGILLKDMEGALEQTVLQIDAEPECFSSIRDGAAARFQRDYSQDALERRMSDLIRDRWIEAGGR
ncbi:MAG: glycosyltransferase [Geminicoccaceae bacterium]